MTPRATKRRTSSPAGGVWVSASGYLAVEAAVRRAHTNDCTGAGDMSGYGAAEVLRPTALDPLLSVVNVSYAASEQRVPTARF
jgi:hypothetical protein